MKGSGRKVSGRKKWYNLLSAIGFIAVLFICIHFVGKMVESKSSRERYEEFWKNPQEYDVWILGNSHIYDAIQPMELWKDYDIYSYSLAAQGGRMPQTYWILKNALRRSKPKLIVLDTYLIQSTKKIEPKSKLAHNAFDVIPFSYTKVQAVCDLFDSREERIEYLWDFYIYHNRWEKLGKEDFDINYNKQKGSNLKIRYEDMSSFVLPEQDMMLTQDLLGYEYLQKIIDECTSRNIPILLISLPSCVSPETQMAMNGVSVIAEKNNIPFLNISYEDNPINYATDFADAGHVNPSGAYKLTKYIGNYIQKNYAFAENEKDEKIKRKWEADYEEYVAYKAELLKEEEQIENYLILLSDDHYLSYVMVRGTENGEKEQIEKLLANVNAMTIVSESEMIELSGNSELWPERADVVVMVTDIQTGESVDIAVFDGKNRITDF